MPRREFLATAAGACALTLCFPSFAERFASPVDIAHIVYSGGNWRPRPTALRRLAWEVHKRTAVPMGLEPPQVKPTLSALSASPLAYMAGDRHFTPWEDDAIAALSRFIRLGGTLIVDTCYTADGDADGFTRSMKTLLDRALVGIEPVPISPAHVIFRSFYDLPRAVGRKIGSPGLTGYSLGGRIAVVMGDHDLAGAWAKDNLGNWEYDVAPGGERQREEAMRLGVNLVMYALCLDYKNEQPHRRFGAKSGRPNAH